MKRLTSQRCNGIKSGYWSTAKKDDLVQRLGRYEDTGLEPEEIKKLKTPWINAKDQPPTDPEEGVLAVVSGQPRIGLTLDDACVIAWYDPKDGVWWMEEYPDWENARVTWWMPMPELPG